MKIEYFRRKSKDSLRKSDDLLTEIRNFVNAIALRSEKSSSGSNLLDVPTYETVTRLTDATLELYNKVKNSKNESLKSMMEELLKEKALADRRRPSKFQDGTDLAYPLSAVDENDNIRARPECMLLDSEDEEGDGERRKNPTTENDSESDNEVDDEEEDEEQDDDDEKKANEASRKKPSNLVKGQRLSLPTPDNSEKLVRYRTNHIKRRVLKSSLIKDLRSQFSDAPEEFREHQDVLGDDFQRVKKSQEKYEEDYFIRLSENKRRKHMQKVRMERSGMDELLSFGQYLPVGDGEDNDPQDKKEKRLRKKRKRPENAGEDDESPDRSARRIPKRRKKKSRFRFI